MAKILLINPNYYEAIFSKSKVKGAISKGTIPLGLACIAAPLVNKGHEVKLLNLNLADDSVQSLKSMLSEYRPDVVGITATTPLIKSVYTLATDIKRFDQNILVVAGGPHPSALPAEVLAESELDCVVKGEGDYIFARLVEEGLSPALPNVFYKNERGEIITPNNQHAMVEDLDELPFPAYELFDIKNYYQPRISSRKQPLAYLETSRGCYARCIYCNKNIHGFKVRMKSPMKVVDEMERTLNLGFQEIHIIDDIFTANMTRAYQICEEILRRGLDFPWYPRGGIRVDRVNPELLKIMKKAGCYRIPYGIESGSQRILDVIKKSITLEQAEDAVAMAKQAGLETECYFMIGLPTETVEDIEKSIDFAIKLDPDYTKFAITIPLPGTPMFTDMEKDGRIKTHNWDKYNFAIPPRELYDHDTLSWKDMDRYYTLSHRKFYFRPRYILRMIYKTIRNGTFWGHVKAFLQTRW